MAKKLAKSSIGRTKVPSGSKAKSIKPRAVSLSKRARGLARDGDPYVTHKGKVIQPDEIRADAPDKIAKHKVFKANKRRTIKELPALPGMLRGISCVFVYTVMGLSDREIGELLNISVTDVRQVRLTSGYEEVFNIVSAEFISAQSKHLSARIASYAENALTTVADLSQNGEKEETKLRASMDLLDRGGIRPKDVEQRTNQQGNELRITIVKGDANVAVNGITVDV